MQTAARTALARYLHTDLADGSLEMMDADSELVTVMHRLGR